MTTVEVDSATAGRWRESKRTARARSMTPANSADGLENAQTEDAELLQAYLAGDTSAFGRLVSRHDLRLRRLCRRYVDDPATIDDLLQETYLRVLARIDRIDHRFNVGAWMQRVTLNLCIDELRRRSRWTSVHSPDQHTDLLGILDCDRRGQPEDALELDTTREQICSAIMQLSTVQRDVLVLRDVRGISEAGTAEILGLGVGSVQGILHRARERFRNTFAAHLVDKGPGASCAQVAFVFENLHVGALRKDRLHALIRHLEGCEWCHTKFASRVHVPAQPARRHTRQTSPPPQVFAA